jgi:5-methylcytosine-specific restriction endonuclease McrBC regulatory subunit McrC
MPDNGFIVAQAEDQKKLSKSLNEMCVMILDKGIHSESGGSTKIFEIGFFMN